MAAPPQGVCIASDANWNAERPTWERLDQAYTVRSWTIDRGRNFELEKTRTGEATIELIDRDGSFDPTNTGATFYPFGPGFQVAIAPANPTTGLYSTLFRGYVTRLVWTPYIDLQHANVRLECVDALGLLAAAEMAPDGTFGDSVSAGNIVFAEDTDLTAVNTRINLVLDQFGWPANHEGVDGVTNGTSTFTAASASFDPADVGKSITIATKGRFTILTRVSATSITISGTPSAGTGLSWVYGMRDLASGNVSLQETTYAPRSQALTVVQDAADSEFVNIANFYAARDNTLTFHGRLMRFDPFGDAYGIQTWNIGDRAAVAADSSYVLASPPLEVSLDDSNLYTSAIATPANVLDETIAAQYRDDSAAITERGIRTWSAENLQTLGGDLAATALEVTALFSDYVVDNMSLPQRPRIGRVTVKNREPGSTLATHVHAILAGVEISDIVHLKTTHNGGGGFDTDFYVEGIHYTCRPGGEVNVTELQLDLSPAGYWDNNPFV